jgi:hypothetical protein
VIDPMDTIEVAIEQRLVGLYSATRTLKELSAKEEGRKVMARSRCLEDLEIVRDQLSRIIKEVGRA